MSDPVPVSVSEPVSALAGASVRGACVGIEDAGPRGQVLLKGDFAGQEMAGAVSEIAGVEMPATWGVRMTGERGAVWMAPDELLLLVPRAEAAAAVERLGQLLAGRHHLALDVSDMRVVLRLTGPLVGEVLAKGVPCDLSDRAFQPGSARRTTTAGIAVALWRLEPELWEIVAFRSHAGHLFAFLEDSARLGSEVGWG